MGLGEGRDAQCAEMERQLAPLRGKAVKTVSTEELQKREKKFCDMFTEFKKRKRLFRYVPCRARPPREKTRLALYGSVYQNGGHSECTE